MKPTLPIRRIEFTTPPEERARLVEEGLDHAWAVVDKRLSAEPEQAGVVHGLLAHLAELYGLTEEGVAVVAGR